jgi:hypothetical protein
MARRRSRAAVVGGRPASEPPIRLPVVIVAHAHFQGFGASDWVSLAVAAAAFVVSVCSLYTTSLRRADIDVIHIESPPELRWLGSSGDTPTEPRLHIELFIANTGSTGTVLTDLRLSYKEHNVFHSRVWRPWHGPLRIVGAEPPSAFERDGARSAFVERDLAWGKDPAVPGPIDVEDLARNVRGLRSMTVTVRWTFKQRKLLRRQHESVTRELPVVVDVEPWRAALIEFWTPFPGRQHLAEIADPYTVPEAHPDAAGTLQRPDES